MVASRGGAKTTSATGPSPTASSAVAQSTTTTAITTTTVDSLKTGLVQLDGILTQSSSGRSNLSTILASVQAPDCSITPTTASAEIQTVIDNRTSTEQALQQLSSADSPQLANLKTTLTAALEASLASDRSYQRAVDNLFGCDTLSPSDPYMQAAAGTDGQATQAKQAFVEAYNPLAQQYGLPTRSADQL